MVDISYFTYRKIVNRDRGPITHVGYFHLDNFFQGFAHLHPNFTYNLKQNYLIYDSVDGNGFSHSPYLAIKIAISEAIERWAFYSCVHSKSAAIFHDKTTTGYAAFPELFYCRVKRESHYEAAERWAVNSWNHKKTNNSSIQKIEDIDYITLGSPFKKTAVVIVWKNTANGYCYGFAAGKNVIQAIQKATKELIRNINVLGKGLTFGGNIYEERLLHFSTGPGHKEFLNMIEDNKNRAITTPTTLYNERIVGPWTKYAKVWRTLYGPANIYTIDQRKDYFLF